MKKRLNEQGYTLLMTFGLIILFAVIGISLIGVSSSGTTRNETRQSTSQSLDLAEKGITFIGERVTQDLETKKIDIDNATGLTNKKNKTDQSINQLLENYSCANVISPGKPATDQTLEIESETGVATVCISKIEAGTSPYSRLVTFKSVGEANSGIKSSTIFAESEIGFSNVPEALNYAVSTNEGGNLYLFGGVEIEGNVKVANTLYSYNRAFWSNTSSPTWEESVLPFIKSQDGVTSPKLFANNVKLIKQNVTPSKLFTPSPSISTETITNETIQKAFHAPDGLAPEIVAAREDNGKIDVASIMGRVSQSVGHRLDGTLIKNYGNNTFNGVNGQSNSINSYKTNADEALYVPGNMRIGRYSANGNYSNDVNQYRDFNLNGNYYVNGDLVISGARLKGNAVIYVKGRVDIEFSTINAGAEAKSNTIFIFAEQPIEIHNISVNSAPGFDNGTIKTDFGGSYINGFFYTNSNFLMYGVGSNTKITGGVSAKHTMFTALRGHGVDQLHKNTSAPVPESSCTGSECSCELNDEDSDGRESSVSNRFDLIDKETLVKAIKDKKNPYHSFWEWQSYNYYEERRNILLMLLENPTGAVKKPITTKDIGKALYLTKQYRTYSTETNDRYSITNNLLRNIDNRFSDFYGYNRGREYKYSVNSIKNAANMLANTGDEAIFKALLLEIYNNTNNNEDKESNDQCSTDREQLDKGKQPTNNNKITGDYRYTSRLTIVYNNDLIKRYTETNAIDLETTKITVIPANIRDMQFD